MGSFVRKTLAALAALSVVLLGLTRIGVTPIAPGTVTGFRQSAPCAGGTLCFGTDGGDLKVIVTLHLRAAGTPGGNWTAWLSDSTRLAVRAQGLPRGGLRLVIMKPEPLPRLAKFEWPSGLDLILRNDRGGVFSLVDWRVDVPDKEGADTRGRARWRGQWMVVCLVFLGIGAFAAVWGAFTRTTQPGVRDLCSQLVRLTISEVDGAPEEDPEAMRALLEAVLLGTLPSSEAVTRHVRGRSYSRGIKVWFTARSRFENHWFKVLEILEDYTEKLNGPADG